MTARVDILDEPESLRRPLLVSIAAHVAVFTSMALYGYMGGHAAVLWGDPHALGGGASVGITPVAQIPLPYRAGPTNPLAADTESQVPQRPKPEPKKEKAPEPDAIPLRGRTRPTAKEPTWARSRPAYRPQTPEKPNQLYGSSGQALSSQMYSMQMGSGGVGMGPGGAFGQVYGAYRDLLEQIVGRHWRTDDVNPRLRTAPAAVVTFDLMRDGSIRNVRIEQSSGDYSLDSSAKRAIYESSPFPPLPAGYNRDSAHIEFWYQLRR